MIKTIKRSEIPEWRTRQTTFAETDVKDFLASGREACECFPPEGKSANSARASYKQAADRLKAPVSVTVRKGRIFMVLWRDGDAQ